MRKHSKQILFTELTLAVLAGAHGTVAAQSYSITQIPTLDPNGVGQIYPLGVSNTGEITGYYNGFTTASGGGYVPQTFVAVVSGNSVATQDLGYIGGDYPTNNINYENLHSWGTAVNGAGTVVGIAQPDDYHDYWDLYQYNGGSNGLTDLGNIAPIPPTNTYYGVAFQGSAAMTFASGISSTGTIVGASMQNVTTIHAVVYQNGAYTDLSAGTNFTSAGYAINPSGTAVVGFQTTTTAAPLDYNSATTAAKGKVATEWTYSNGSWTATSLGTLNPSDSSAQSIAYGINASGQIVGVSDTATGAPDAFLRQPDGTMIELDGSPSGSSGSTIGNPLSMSSIGFNQFGYKGEDPDIFNSDLTNLITCPDAINDKGVIVGYTTIFGGKRAFLATVNSSNVPTIVNLNTLIPANLQGNSTQLWNLQEATGINDAGEIVGYGTFNGSEAAFALNLASTGMWTGNSSGSWGSASNWLGSVVPGGVGSAVTFAGSPGLTSSGTVTLDGNRTVGFLTFNSTNSYTIAQGSGGTLTIDDSNDPAGPTPVITVAAGSHSIDVPIVLATNNGSSGLTINAWTGTTLTLGGPMTALNGGSGVLTVSGNGNVVVTPSGSIAVPIVDQGTLTFAANTNTSAGILIRNVPSITLTSAANIYVAPAATRASRQLLVVNSVNLPYQIPEYGSASIWMGQIDLANNDMDVPNGNLATLTSMVAQACNQVGLDVNTYPQKDIYGYYSGDPSAFSNVGGIISSSAANDTTYLTALGVIQNRSATGSALYTTFDGQPVSATDVLIKYTYYGDANDDGVVDASDYSLIDNGYLNQLTGWYNGDFNYDGVINGSDYTLIDNAFNMQGESLASQVAPAAQATTELVGELAGSGTTSPVPEPATLGLAGLAAAGLLGRRRRGGPAPVR